MSSSPRTDRRLWSGWSLRARLLTAMVALVAGVCGAIGVVTVVAVRPYLVQQLDEQLRAAAARAGGPPRAGGPGGHGPAGCDLRGLSGIGNGPGTLGACLDGGQVTEAERLVQDDGSVTAVALRSDQYAALTGLPADRRPYTVDLGDLGAYRLIATPLPDGDVRVTGLPLSGVDATMWWLIAIETAVVAAGVVAAAASRPGGTTITVRLPHRATIYSGQTAPAKVGERSAAHRRPHDAVTR